MDPVPQSEEREKAPAAKDPSENPPTTLQGLQAMTLPEVVAWKESLGFMMVGYVTGFNSNIKSCYHKSAVTRLAYNGLLALSGDAFHETGYTSIIPDFLKQPPDRNKPPRKVVVFLLAGQAEARSSWERIEADFPGRVFVCIVDLDKDVDDSVREELGRAKGLSKASQDNYLLSRTVIKVTKAKRVLALGGDSVVAHVAEATTTEDNPKYLQVKWVVFALGRGQKEQSRSVANWASETKSPLMDCFKRGLDKEELLAFADPEAFGEQEGDLVPELPSQKADPPTPPHELQIPAVLASPPYAARQLGKTQVASPPKSTVAAAAKSDPPAKLPSQLNVPADPARPPDAAGQREKTQVVSPFESTVAAAAKSDPPAELPSQLNAPTDPARPARAAEQLKKKQAAPLPETAGASGVAAATKSDPPAELPSQLNVRTDPARPPEAAEKLEETRVVSPLESTVAAAAKSDPPPELPPQLNVPTDPARPPDAAGQLAETQAAPLLESAGARDIATAEKAAVVEAKVVVPPDAATAPVLAAPAVYAAPLPVHQHPDSSFVQTGVEKIQPSVRGTHATASILPQPHLQRCCLADPLLFLRVPRRGGNDAKLAPPILAGWGGA